MNYEENGYKTKSLRYLLKCFSWVLKDWGISSKSLSASSCLFFLLIEVFSQEYIHFLNFSFLHILNKVLILAILAEEETDRDHKEHVEDQDVKHQPVEKLGG